MGDTPHTALSLQRAFRYLFVEELHELQRLARTLPPNPTVINIGAGAGTSGLALCESRSDLRLVSIDVQGPASPLGCLSAEEHVLREANLWHQAEQILGDSKDVGRDWKRPQVDMVFVDGDHSYEGCIGDIEAWLPHLKPGGLLAIHDFDKGKIFRGLTETFVPHPKPWPGVDRAVKEVDAQGELKRMSLVRTLVTFRKP